MHARSNARKSASARRAGASSSPSANEARGIPRCRAMAAGARLTRQLFPSLRSQAYPVRAALVGRSSVTRAYTARSFRKPLIQRLFCLFAARLGEAHSCPILFAATWAGFAAHPRGFHYTSLTGQLGRRDRNEIEVALIKRVATCDLRRGAEALGH